MSVFTPPPDAPQRGDRATFSNRVDAFLTWLIGFVSQLISFESNLNSIAAGGAYAIPFLLDTSSITDADPGTGKMRFNNAVQSSATALFVDTSNSAGSDVTNQLVQFGASTSTIKGTLRIIKQNDASKYLVFNITSLGTPTGYRQLLVANVDASSASPFAANDTLQLQFTRVGDKGDLGTATSLKVSERYPSGTAGGTAPLGTFTRTANTIEYNTIIGASYTSGVLTLPAGTYDITGRAAVSGNTATFNKTYLMNTSDSVIALTGEGRKVINTTDNAFSSFSGRLVLASQKTFQLMTYNGGTGAGTLGYPFDPSGGGRQEVYAELEVKKVG